MRTMVFAFLFAVVLLGGSVFGVEISTKNNIGGHMEYQGFFITSVSDVPANAYASDLAPAQMFEIIRPGMQAFTIGRLYASCTCIQVETDQKSYGTGERALVTLRNVQPTQGQMYPFYIQLSSPVRAVLRRDTFVISDRFANGGGGSQTEAGMPELPTLRAATLDSDSLGAMLDGFDEELAPVEEAVVAPAGDDYIREADLGF